MPFVANLASARQTKSRNLASPRELFAGLIAFTVLYQLASMVRFSQMAEDDSCSALGVDMQASQQCVEMRLFQNWKTEAANLPEASDEELPAESEHELHELLEADDASEDHNSGASKKTSSTVEDTASIAAQLTLLAGWDGSTDADLMHLQERLQARHTALLAAQKNHSVQREQVPTQPGNNDTSLLDDIRKLHLELCSDPKRRDYPGCADVLSPLASEGTTTSSAQGTLAASASSTTAAARPEQYSEVFLGAKWDPDERIQWRSVKDWASLGKDGLISVTKSDLSNKKWSGMIPKVACITAISDGRAARARLKYFINNFLLQNYEGPKQLILVYHRNDELAAKLAKAHSDGSFIKAVAAFGEGEFPSSTAFRYGAWSADADADVVAHWDFDEWHHPARLAMQIRAMGVTGRPVSILKQWSVLQNGQHSTLFAGIGWEGSLVGEAKWMHEHWHPLLQEERVLLESGREHHVAQVVMPELSVYNAGSGDWASVLRHFGRENTVDVTAEDLATLEQNEEVAVGGLWRMPKELENDEDLTASDIQSVVSQEQKEAWERSRTTRSLGRAAK